MRLVGKRMIIWEVKYNFFQNYIIMIHKDEYCQVRLGPNWFEENVRFTTPIQQLYNNLSHEGGSHILGPTLMWGVVVQLLYWCCTRIKSLDLMAAPAPNNSIPTDTEWCPIPAESISNFAYSFVVLQIPSILFENN
jgi:hypothetical protein